MFGLLACFSAANCYSYAFGLPDRMKFRNPGYQSTHRLLQRPFTKFQLQEAVWLDHPDYVFRLSKFQISPACQICALIRSDGKDFHFAKQISSTKWVFSTRHHLKFNTTWDQLRQRYFDFELAFCMIPSNPDLPGRLIDDDNTLRMRVHRYTE